MNALLTRPLRRLAGTLADLRVRVREALAGELSRAVGEAVREVVATVVRGNPADEPPNHVSPRKSPDRWADDADPWDDHSSWQDEGHEPEPDEHEPPASASTEAPGLIYRPPAGPAAVSAGLTAGKWWLRRPVLVAAGVGAAVAAASYAAPPAVSAAIGGAGGLCTALTVQGGLWVRATARQLGLV